MASLPDMTGFEDLIAGWEISVTMQLRTPLEWLRRHREYRAGAKRPTKALPPEHACWVPVPKTWRDLGIDADEIPPSTMASQVGQIPVDGGDFLPFLLDYQAALEPGAETLASVRSQHPRYAYLIPAATPASLGSPKPARRIKSR
jgi:hypothetical protein